MKRTMVAAAYGIAIAVLAAPGGSLRAETPPGQVDFGTLSTAGSNSGLVEVNVPANLIGLAARFIEKQEPDVAKLLDGLQLVHVSVIGLNDQNRAELEKQAEKFRNELETKGWERVVKVLKDGQDIGIYLKTQGKETVQGLALVVFAGKEQAVFANVVGDIRPEQLALLGERLHLEPLKKLGMITNTAGQ
jgi:hypothetical protein